jgi:hypothetical protein
VVEWVWYKGCLNAEYSRTLTRYRSCPPPSLFGPTNIRPVPPSHVPPNFDVHLISPSASLAIPLVRSKSNLACCINFGRILLSFPMFPRVGTHKISFKKQNILLLLRLISPKPIPRGVYASCLSLHRRTFNETALTMCFLDNPPIVVPLVRLQQ